MRKSKFTDEQMAFALKQTMMALLVNAQTYKQRARFTYGPLLFNLARLWQITCQVSLCSSAGPWPATYDRAGDGQPEFTKPSCLGIKAIATDPSKSFARKESMIHEAPSSPPKDAWEEVTRDLALLEKYKEFSEELLKVSIAVVAVLGFFFDKVAGASYFEIQDRKSIALHLVIAASLFVGSGVAALSHRLIGLGAASLAVRGLRRTGVGDESSAARDRRGSRTGYQLSSLLLGVAGVLAILGTGVLLSALAVVGPSFHPRG